MPRVPKLPQPLLASLRVEAASVDEFYGVECHFTWAPGFDAAGYLATIAAEERSFRQTPGRIQTGPFPRVAALKQAVVTAIFASREWRDFYAVPQRVSAQTTEDGPERVVRVPRFRSIDDFSDWDFTATGGWISADRRDGE